MAAVVIEEAGTAAVRVETRDRITTVILDRAHAKNAVDGPAAEALARAFCDFDADAHSDVAVLCGANDTFCAGADLKADQAALERIRNPTRSTTT